MEELPLEAPGADRSQSPAVEPNQPGALSSGDDTAFQPVHPDSVIAERISWWILTGCIILPGLITVVSLTGHVPPWIHGVLGVALVSLLGLFLVLSRRWPEADYRHKAWRLDDAGIEIRKGVIWRQAVYVPRSRVQHVDVSQGPLQRRYRLGTLTVHTAGSQAAQVALEGLAYDVAMAVRDQFLGRAPAEPTKPADD